MNSIAYIKNNVLNKSKLFNIIQIILSLVVFALFFLFTMMQTAYVESISSLWNAFDITTKVLMFVLFAFYILDSVLKKQINIIHILFISLSIPTYVITKDGNFFYLMLMFASFSIFDKKYILNFVFLGILLAYIFIFIMTLANVFPCLYKYRYIKEGLATRLAIGFDYPIIPQHLIFQLICIYLYEKDTNTSWLEVIYLLLTASIIYLFDYARTDYYLTLALLFIFSLYKIISKFKFKKDHKIIRNICAYSSGLIPILLCVFIFVIVHLYDKGILVFSGKDNTILSRIKMISYTFLSFKINFFGQYINFNYEYLFSNIPFHITLTGSYYFIDTAYIYCLYLYGIIPFLILLTTLILINYKLIKNKKFFLFFILLLFQFGGLFEQFMIIRYSSIFLFFIYDYLPFIKEFNINKLKLLV